MTYKTIHPLRFNDRISLAATLGAFVLGASICSEAPNVLGAPDPIWPTKEWRTSSPEEQGMDSKELAKLVDFGTTRSLDSLLVVRHGKIVAEAYYAPNAAGIPHAVYSAVKGVISTLEPELRYSNFFWIVPDKHAYAASGYHGQVIMVFPRFGRCVGAWSLSLRDFSGFYLAHSPAKNREKNRRTVRIVRRFRLAKPSHGASCSFRGDYEG
jgi:hypothetical protein